MNRSKILYSFFSGTLFSVMIFFAISFLTILLQMPPFSYQEHFPQSIGFPFSYYDQLWLKGGCTPNHGWNLTHLLLDCVLTWIIVSGVYVLVRVKRGKGVGQVT